MRDVLHPGQIISRHRVVRLLGAGGMGAVYEVLHIELERRDALKIMLPEFAARADLRGRFIREAKVTNRVHHPGIVQIYEISELPEGIPYFIMEYLDGDTLGKRIDEASARPPGRMGVIGMGPLRQVATIIARCHEKGLIHRDLKPNNIMLVKDPDVPGGERAKLLDFGIVKIQDEKALTPKGAEGPQTQAGQLLGTPEYMAPEQWASKRPITEKVDVYALGVMAYRILSGQLPFTADSPLAFAAKHVFDDPLSLRSVVPELSLDLCTLVERMLEKQADKRPGMQEVVGALDSIFGRQQGQDAQSGQLVIPDSFSSAEQVSLASVADPPGLSRHASHKRAKAESRPAEAKNLPAASVVNSIPPPADAEAALPLSTAGSFVPSSRPAPPDASTARGNEPAHQTISLDYEALLPTTEAPAANGHLSVVGAAPHSASVPRSDGAQEAPKGLPNLSPSPGASALTEQMLSHETQPGITGLPPSQPPLPSATAAIPTENQADPAPSALLPSPLPRPARATGWTILAGLVLLTALGLFVWLRSPSVGVLPDLASSTPSSTDQALITASRLSSRSDAVAAPTAPSAGVAIPGVQINAQPNSRLIPPDAGRDALSDLASRQNSDLETTKLIGTKTDGPRCIPRVIDETCIITKGLLPDEKRLVKTGFMMSDTRICAGERLELIIKNGKPYASRVPPSLRADSVDLLQYSLSGLFRIGQFPQFVAVQCAYR